MKRMCKGDSNIIVLFVYCRSEAIVKEVLDELGLQMNEELGTLTPAVGGLAGPSTDTNKQSDASADADLEARLNNLRRD